MDKLVDERGRDYRAFCGSPGEYGLQGAAQFRLMTELGLREGHYLLDIGCGSLRAGRLFMTYLDPGHYYGFDPNFWAIEEAIKHELGKAYIEKRRPVLDDEANFTLTKFNRQFHFMLSQSVFSHASLAQIDRCLSEVSKCLRPNGAYAGSMHIDGKVRYEGGWSWPTCSHHLRKDIEELTSKHHLAMKILDRRYWHHYSRDYPQTWILWSHEGCTVDW